MSPKLLIALVFIALSGVSVGYVYYNPSLSPDNWVYEGHSPTNWNNGGVHPAPGPIAGAGLPFAAAGYLAYWLIKRRRRKAD